MVSRLFEETGEPSRPLPPDELAAARRALLTAKARRRLVLRYGDRRQQHLDPIIARVKSQLLALAREHGKILDPATKYSEAQLRDYHGRWTVGGDVAPGSDSMRSAVGAFASMPNVRDMKTAAAQKWFRDNAALYAENKDFRTLVAAGSAYTQGQYAELRGGAEYAMSGTLPPADGMNEQAWTAYMTGQRWRNDFGAAPEGAADGTKVGYYTVAGGRLVGSWNPAPTLPLAADISAYATEEAPEGMKYPEQVGFPAAGLALSDAIAASDPVDQTLYRGFALQGAGETDLRDGAIYQNTGQHWNYDTQQWEHLPGTPVFTVGQTLDLAGPSSFTTDQPLADRISSGRAKMGDNYSPTGSASVIFKVDGAQALNVQALSPYRQSEYLTNGRFTITGIDKQWTTARQQYQSGTDTVPQYIVTLKQEGTWRPPS